MARYSADLQLLFSILSGNEMAILDTSNRPKDGRAALKSWRVASFTDDGVAPVSGEIGQAVEKAAQALRDAGLIVNECSPPAVDRGHELWLKLFSRASVIQLRQIYSGHEEEAGAFVRWRLATADDHPATTLDEYISAWLERDRLRLALDEWMMETPLIVAPVGATPAFKHDTLKVTVSGQTLSVFRAFSYTQTFNVFDLPSVCVQAGLSSEGLPIGVQIVGRPNQEDVVFVASAIVEDALGGWTPPKIH